LSNIIAVRFAMTKGDGDFPDEAQFTEDEKADIRSCLTLSLNWDHDELSIDNVNITSVEFIYDGINHYGDQRFGYWFENGCLNGYPAPIISFTVDKDVNRDEFLRAIWSSSMILKSESMEEPFYAEDQNGYSEILDDDQLEDWDDELQEFGLAVPEAGFVTVEFPDGLPVGGYQLSAKAFAIDPKRE
jgi:hypothetical protein